MWFGEVVNPFNTRDEQLAQNEHKVIVVVVVVIVIMMVIGIIITIRYCYY